MVRTTVLLLSIALAQVAWADARWPTIRSARESIDVIDADNTTQAALEMTIYSKDKKPLYDLKCHSGDYDSNDHNYSGLIQCYLFSKYSADRVENLLNDSQEQQRDWQNRGRFLAIHLAPGCSGYPEWGSIRHFKLRDMELTLSISDVVLVPNPKNADAPLAKSYKFEVIAKPDTGIPSSIAERVNPPEPPWFYSTACRAK
jgi:hypothetical protein